MKKKKKDQEVKSKEGKDCHLRLTIYIPDKLAPLVKRNARKVNYSSLFQEAFKCWYYDQPQDVVSQVEQLNGQIRKYKRRFKRISNICNQDKKKSEKGDSVTNGKEKEEKKRK